MIADKHIISCAMLFFILTGVRSADAGTRRLDPGQDEHLLYGLKSLKAKAEQVKMNNRWLAQENEAFRQQIYILQRELERLEENTPASAEDSQEGFPPPGDRADSNRQDPQKALRDNELRGQQHRILVRHTEQQEDTQKALHDRIIQMKQDAVYLENEINQLKSSIDRKTRNLDFVSEKNRLLELKNDSDFNLKLVRREIEALKKRYYKPLSQLSKYREEQLVLKQKLAIAEDELKIAMAEEKKLRQEIHELEISRKETIEDFIQDIKALRDQRKDLEAVLGQAKEKIKENNVDLSASNAELFQFEENLKVLKNENNLLKKDLFDLKKLFNEASQ